MEVADAEGIWIAERQTARHRRCPRAHSLNRGEGGTGVGGRELPVECAVPACKEMSRDIAQSLGSRALHTDLVNIEIGEFGESRWLGGAQQTEPARRRLSELRDKIPPLSRCLACGDSLPQNRRQQLLVWTEASGQSQCTPLTGCSFNGRMHRFEIGSLVRKAENVTPVLEDPLSASSMSGNLDRLG